MSTKSRHVDRAIDQGGEAVGLVIDMIVPGLREKLIKRGAPSPDVVEPRRDDIVVEADAPNACPNCDGAGELQTCKGRFVTCTACGGKGVRS